MFEFLSPASVRFCLATQIAVATAGFSATSCAGEFEQADIALAAAAPAEVAPIAARRRSGPVAAASARLLVRSYQSAAISAEVNARIVYLPAREGDRFKKGDVLVEFDCRRIAAELDAALAAYNAHRVAFETQSKLKRYNAAGAFAVQQARYEMNKSQAEAESLKVRKTTCVIRAPFDGRVSEKAAQVHEVAQPNQPLIRIVNDFKLELVLMVPSASFATFAKGAQFKVKIDETGELHDAWIVQSTGLIDPVSQSVRLIGEFIGPASNVLPGMSGTATFTRSEATR